MSHFKMFKTLLRLSLFLIVVSVLGCGQTTTEGEQTSQVMFTPPTRIHQPTFRPRHQPQDGSRVAIYDVSDLLISIPNYDLPQNTFIWTRVNARDLPSAGADEDIPVSDKLSPASGSLTKEKMQDRIRESIQATISRESWKSPMLLQYRDDAMIVRQTEENHKQIESLLGKMRATRKYSVQTEARVFVVSAAEAEKIQSSIDERSFDFDPPTSSKINNKKKSENGICKAYLSPEKFKEMGDYLDAQKVTSFAAPRLTTYNGQKAYVLVESPMTMDVSRNKESESVLLMTQCGYGLSTDVTIAQGYENLICSLEFRMGLLALDVPQKRTIPSPYGVARSVVNRKTTLVIPNGNWCVLRFPVNEMAVAKIKDAKAPKGEESVEVEECLIPATPETQRYAYLFLKSTIVTRDKLSR